MRPGIALRPDYDAAQLWALAKATRDAGQSRRLLALAEIYDGGSRTKAARIGGVGLQEGELAMFTRMQFKSSWRA